MEWSDLRHVLAVARGQTLASAGRLLKVDATTVGRRIMAIERDLGARLFDRTPDGYLPTHAGRIAIDHAERMELASLSLAQQIGGSDEQVAGPVRVTALDQMLNRILLPKVPILLARYPGLEITFSSGIAVLNLDRREADIALRTIRPTHPDAVGRWLATTAGTVYGARGIDFGPFPPVISTPKGSGTDDFDRLLQQFLPGCPVVVRTNTEGHILELVRAGVGVCCFDCFVGDSEPGLRRLQPDTLVHEDLWAVTHVDMHRTPRVQAVLSFIADCLAEAADLIEGRCPQP
jgi:DNA-binding transcriptional LysR family regulator